MPKTPWDPFGKAFVRQADLVAAMRDLGVRPGDLIQVHSSLNRLGYVEGGAETVVDALLEVVGPDGTVMVPTFNHGAAEIYDPAETPSTNGVVTEAFRKRSEARRSLHPTHPYAAIGPQADYLVDGHLDVETFDPKSPLGKLADLGGWVLLLGIGMTANTAAHIGETMARVPCIGYGRLKRQVKLPDGRIIPATSVTWRDGPCLIEWDPLEERMKAAGLIRYGNVGDGELRLMKAKDVIDTTFAMTAEFCPTCKTRAHPAKET
jgi:aminoglycoside 3-N-acetyltransferase